MKKYAAFISYRHMQKDGSIAKELHRKLERLHVPDKKKRRFFRDEEELPTSADLGKDIDEALIDSEYLIVICSPRLPKSKWCLKEVESFVERGLKDRILPVLIEGDISESVPEIIRDIPIAADLRNKAKTDLQTAIQLMNMITGIEKARIERNESVHRLVSISVAMACIIAAFICFAFYARDVAKKISIANEELVEAKILVEKAEAEAKTERDKALLNRAKTFSVDAEKSLEAGDTIGAIETLLPVLTIDDAPRSDEAMCVLRTAMSIPDLNYEYKRSLVPSNDEEREIYNQVISLMENAVFVPNEGDYEKLGIDPDEALFSDGFKLGMAVITKDGTLSTYSLSDYTRLNTAEGKYIYVHYPFVSTELYAITDEGVIRLLDAKTLEVKKEITCTTPAKKLYSCTSKSFLLVTCEGSVEVYRTDSGSKVFAAETPEEPLCAIFDKYWRDYSIITGNVFYVIYKDRVDLYEIKQEIDPLTSNFIPLINDKAIRQMDKTFFSKDGKYIYTAESHEALYKWDAESGKLIWHTNASRDYAFESGSIISLDITGNYIYRNGKSAQELEKIDLETGKIIYAVTADVTGVVPIETPDSITGIIHYGGPHVQAINTATGKTLWTHEDKLGRNVSCITFSDNGSKVSMLVGSKSGAALNKVFYRILDAKNGKVLSEKEILNANDPNAVLYLKEAGNYCYIEERFENKSRFHFIDMETGAVSAEYELANAIFSENSDGRIFVEFPSDDDSRGGWVYSFLDDNGKPDGQVKEKSADNITERLSKNSIMYLGEQKLYLLDGVLYDFETGIPVLNANGRTITGSPNAPFICVMDGDNYCLILHGSADDELLEKAVKRLEAQKWTE